MSHIKKTLINYESIFAAITGIVPSFLLGLNSATMPIPYRTLVLSITVTLLIFWLAMIWKKSTYENSIFTAKIINFDVNNEKLLFKMNIKNILSIESIFLIYRKENQYEEKTAVAIVENIQAENDLVQAKIYAWIQEPKATESDKIIIKPTCTQDIVKIFLNEEREKWKI